MMFDHHPERRSSIGVLMAFFIRRGTTSWPVIEVFPRSPPPSMEGHPSLPLPGLCCLCRSSISSCAWSWVKGKASCSFGNVLEGRCRADGPGGGPRSRRFMAGRAQERPCLAPSSEPATDEGRAGPVKPTFSSRSRLRRSHPRVLRSEPPTSPVGPQGPGPSRGPDPGRPRRPSRAMRTGAVRGTDGGVRRGRHHGPDDAPGA